LTEDANYFYQSPDTVISVLVALSVECNVQLDTKI